MQESTTESKSPTRALSIICALAVDDAEDANHDLLTYACNGETFSSDVCRTVQWYMDHRTWCAMVEGVSCEGRRFGLVSNTSKGAP